MRSSSVICYETFVAISLGYLPQALPILHHNATLRFLVLEHAEHFVAVITSADEVSSYLRSLLHCAGSCWCIHVSKHVVIAN